LAIGLSGHKEKTAEIRPEKRSFFIFLIYIIKISAKPVALSLQ